MEFRSQVLGGGKAVSHAPKRIFGQLSRMVMSRQVFSNLLRALCVSPILASLATAAGGGTPDFVYIAPNLVAEPGQTVTVALVMDNNLGLVQGWSMDIEIPLPLSIDAEGHGQVVDDFRFGLGPQFDGCRILPGEGFTTGILIDFMGNDFLQVGTGHELHLIDVTVPANAAPGTVYPLAWSEILGDPPVENIVVLGGQSHVPHMIDGSITVGFHTTFCYGDGSGNTCPCGNTGGPGEGCANSAGIGGLLSVGGSASVGADDLEMTMTGGPGVTAALLFVGTTQVNSGQGVVFGDGLRCAGGQIKRLGVRISDASGSASWGPGLAASGGWASGDTRYFQSWYRDVVGSPCAGNFNLSQGVAISMAP